MSTMMTRAAVARAQQLGLTGTDADKVALLQTMTSRPIVKSTLRQYLRDNDLLIKTDPPSGELSDLDHPLFKLLFEGFDDADLKIIRTDADVYGPKFSGSVDGLVAAGGLPQGHADALYSLGGGRIWADLTVEQFTAARVEIEAAAALESQITAWQVQIDTAWNEWRAGNASQAATILSQIVTEMGG